MRRLPLLKLLAIRADRLKAMRNANRETVPKLCNEDESSRAGSRLLDLQRLPGEGGEGSASESGSGGTDGEKSEG